MVAHGSPLDEAEIPIMIYIYDLYIYEPHNPGKVSPSSSKLEVLWAQAEISNLEGVFPSPEASV